MIEEPRTYEVQNGEGNILSFTGELVAHVSSSLPEKPRYTEFYLYLTDFDTWVLHGVGRSRVPGETDRHWYVASNDEKDILEKIMGDDVSRLAKKLIAESLRYLKRCD